jgi:hypothetical protein
LDQRGLLGSGVRVLAHPDPGEQHQLGLLGLLIRLAVDRGGLERSV